MYFLFLWKVTNSVESIWVFIGQVVYAFYFSGFLFCNTAVNLYQSQLYAWSQSQCCSVIFAYIIFSWMVGESWCLIFSINDPYCNIFVPLTAQSVVAFLLMAVGFPISLMTPRGYIFCKFFALVSTFILILCFSLCEPSHFRFANTSSLLFFFSLCIITGQFLSPSLSWFRLCTKRLHFFVSYHACSEICVGFFSGFVWTFFFSFWGQCFLLCRMCVFVRQ